MASKSDARLRGASIPLTGRAGGSLDVSFDPVSIMQRPWRRLRPAACLCGSKQWYPRSGQHTGMGRSVTMKVFLDFEASSLSDRSYPIEIAWVFEDGRSEAHLIAPARGWNDWDDVSQSIHGISRAMLEAEGEPHDVVATRMVAALAGHDLFASAPSWDGKWLSVLLREAALPRHLLRLRDTDQAISETVAEILRLFLRPTGSTTRCTISSRPPPLRRTVNQHTAPWPMLSANTRHGSEPGRSPASCTSPAAC